MFERNEKQIDPRGFSAPGGKLDSKVYIDLIILLMKRI